MKTKRLLVIEKLVAEIPDDFPTADPNKITIDEALQYLVSARQTAKAVLHNTAGNYEYFNAAIPVGISPDVPETFTKEILFNTLDQNPGMPYAGVMATLVYDEELKGYRNIYNATEEAEFQKKKAEYLEYLANQLKDDSDEEESDIPVGKGEAVDAPSPSHEDQEGILPCSQCEYDICDENCPNNSVNREE